MNMIPKVEAKYRNDKANKRGEFPIILQVIFDRKVFRMSTGLSAAPGLLSGNQILGADRSTYLANMHLRDKIVELDKKILDIYAAGNLTEESLKQVFSRKEVGGNMNMTQLFEAVKRIYGGVLSPSRIAGLNSSVVKFEKWSKGLPVSKISASTLLQYQGHISAKNKPTSVWADMKDLKTIVNKAREHNIIACNPFDGYKLPGYKQPQRNHLLQEEVQKIEAFADDEGKNMMLRTVAAWFVLGCHSGLRFSDLAVWDENKMVRGKRLYFSDEKTDTPHFVPLHPKLMAAIERIRAYRTIYENQVCNRLLKEIAGLCDIERKVTMHTARHTFAVGYLEAGGSMETLQKLMGHAKISTTEIYGQITAARIENEAGRVWGSQ